MNKHPAAYDPLLQDKIDAVCKTPEEWNLRYQIDKLEDHVQHNVRMVRALEREIERSQECLQAFRLALINIQDLKKEVEDR